MTEFHANVFRRADGTFELLDNCSEVCEAQEARMLGGDVWEMYATSIEQHAGADGIRSGAVYVRGGTEPMSGPEQTRRRLEPMKWLRWFRAEFAEEPFLGTTVVTTFVVCGLVLGLALVILAVRAPLYLLPFVMIALVDWRIYRWFKGH